MIAINQLNSLLKRGFLTRLIPRPEQIMHQFFSITISEEWRRAKNFAGRNPS